MAGLESSESNKPQIKSKPDGYGDARFTDSTVAGRMIGMGPWWSFSQFLLNLMNFLIDVARWLLGLNNRTSTDFRVSGTHGAFNAIGSGSEMQAEGAIINSGRAAGNPNHTAADNNPPEECSGTSNAFTADCGGKINIRGATVNAGAFAGSDRTVCHVPSQPVAPKELDSNPKKHSQQN